MAEVETLSVPEASNTPDASTPIDPAQTQAQTKERNAKNSANLKQHARVYGIAAVASLTLFGAAQTWATASGLPIAMATGIAAAVIAGMVLSSILHEWGHYLGAALAGSTIKIADKPSDYFFFLNFNPKANTQRQALSLTWGGLAGSWLLVAGVAALIPLGSWYGAVLLATVAGRAINASVFELPIAWQTLQGNDFKTALKSRLESPGVVSMPGLIAGLALLVIIT